jgi:hypothetical protein
MKTTYWLFSLVLGLQVALGVDARVKTGLDVLSEQHFAPREVYDSTRAGVEAFRMIRAKYLLYE